MMKTVYERWSAAAAESGAAALSPQDYSAAMLMFYSGFCAALVATMELASLPEAEAMAAMTAMRDELRRVEAAATQALMGGAVQ